ncbi:unnamed protein product [Ilex paraguariensis]|uniref:Uncharacterized protein n=1 Tax=Ilex paraguariensis TaxID=185542 RepID=A0ABC8RL54_9AQUA
MKKVFYYNYIPNKAEEEACKVSNTPWQVTRVLEEIRDIYPPPVIDYQNPWQIKKTLTHYEAATGKLVVSFVDAFEHVFRYWTLCMANHVVLGHKVTVIVWDVTEQNNPKRYRNDSVFFEMLPNDDYILACMDVFKDQCLNVDDEIGVFWDPRASTFQFKLLCRGGKPGWSHVSNYDISSNY